MHIKLLLLSFVKKEYILLLYIKFRNGTPTVVPPLEPKIALTDFEAAMQNSLIEASSGIEIKRCFFHFKHAIHDWITQNGYKTDYTNNSNFRVWVDMLSALSKIPMA